MGTWHCDIRHPWGGCIDRTRTAHAVGSPKMLFNYGCHDSRRFASVQPLLHWSVWMAPVADAITRFREANPQCTLARQDVRRRQNVIVCIVLRRPRTPPVTRPI